MIIMYFGNIIIPRFEDRGSLRASGMADAGDTCPGPQRDKGARTTMKGAAKCDKHCNRRIP